MTDLPVIGRHWYPRRLSSVSVDRKHAELDLLALRFQASTLS